METLLTGDMLQRVVNLKSESILILVVVFQRYMFSRLKKSTEELLRNKDRQTDDLIKSTAEMWWILAKYNSRLSDLFYVLQNAQAYCIRDRKDIQDLLNKKQEDETEDEKDNITNI